MIDELFDDIPDTSGREEVVPVIDEHPLLSIFDRLQDREFKSYREIGSHPSEQRKKIWIDDVQQFFETNPITPRQVTRYWAAVSSRHDDFDIEYAGYFMGLLVSSLRESGDTTTLVFDTIELPNFCEQGRCVSSVVFGDIVADKCCRDVQVLEDILVTGVVSGKECFRSERHNGVARNIMFLGEIHGDSCCEGIGSRGLAEHITFINTITGRGCLADAGVAGHIKDVVIRANIEGGGCCNSIASGGGLAEDIHINGDITASSFCYGRNGPSMIDGLVIDGIVDADRIFRMYPYTEDKMLKNVSFSGLFMPEVSLESLMFITKTLKKQREQVKRRSLYENVMYAYENLRNTKHITRFREYAALEQSIHDKLWCYASDVQKFWEFVETRQDEFDKEFASLFAGMLISKLRDCYDETHVFLPKITLPCFAKYGRNISLVVICNGVYGEQCFARAGGNYGRIGGIGIIGGVHARDCFRNAGYNDGVVEFVSVDGDVSETKGFFEGAENLSEGVRIGKQTSPKPSTAKQVQEVVYGSR